MHLNVICSSLANLLTFLTLSNSVDADKTGIRSLICVYTVCIYTYISQLCKQVSVADDIFKLIFWRQFKGLLINRRCWLKQLDLSGLVNISG